MITLGFPASRNLLRVADFSFDIRKWRVINPGAGLPVVCPLPTVEGRASFRPRRPIFDSS